MDDVEFVDVPRRAGKPLEEGEVGDEVDEAEGSRAYEDEDTRAYEDEDEDTHAN